MAAGRASLKAFACVLAVLLVAPSAAWAHALLERSEPPAGVVVPAERTPQRISLWFTEPVGVRANAIAVLNSDNRRVEKLNARAAAEEPARVDVDLGELPQGAYLVRWRVTSADDHVVSGSYWFVVGFAPTPPPSAQLLGSGAPRLSAVELAARWLGLMALLCLAGSPLFRLAVRPPAPGLPRGTWIVAGAVFVVAHAMLAAGYSESVAELPFPQSLSGAVLEEIFFGSRFAVLWWTRLALALALVALLCAARVRLAAIAGLLLIVASALGSHATGARTAPTLAVTVDAVHLAAAAMWLGGLFELARLLPGVMRSADRAQALRTLVPRVSAVFLATVLVLVATGIFSAWEQVATPKALLATAYGEGLLVKIGVLALLLAIAAFNLLVARPRLTAGDERMPARFLANVRAEVALGTLLLAAVALLASLPPPAQQPLPAPLEVQRQADDLRVTLRIDPVWVGVSRFRVTLADAQGNPPADVGRVVLTFTMEGMNMGRTNVTLTPKNAGVFEAEGFYMGMPGISQIGVAVDRAGADRSAVFRVEVPDVNPRQFAGLPALLGLGDAFPGVSGTPSRADAASLERGRKAYAENCAMCHGATGIGDGPAARSLLPPPADLTLHARWHADEQLNWFIAHGVPGTSMIAFADRLGAAERWDVINHLQELARAPTASARRGAPVKAEQVVVPPAAPAEIRPPTGEGAPGGRLVYGPDYDNNLWILDLPDGKPRPLTRLGPKEFSSNPAWSRDGRRIAFSYYRLPDDARFPVPDGTDLYVINADGSGLRALAVHDASGVALQYPAWSADGSSIYVTYAAPGGAGLGIDRVDVKSGARTRVVEDAAYPALSRDGRRLAYVRYTTVPDRGESLWSSAPDGSDARQVVGVGMSAKYFGLRFSPDGRRLVFAAIGQPPEAKSAGAALLRLLGIGSAHANGDLWDLWTVDLDGRNLRALTAIGEDLPVAAWSPDGREIVFLGGGSASSGEAGLTLLDPVNRTLRRLTTQPGHRGIDWRK